MPQHSTYYAVILQILNTSSRNRDRPATAVSGQNSVTI